MKYKNQTKAFSIIELIIVLAVIGILALILIPLLSDTISRSNAKSALSDAKNTLTNYMAQLQEKDRLCDSVIIVEKAGYYYTYGYVLSVNKLYESVNQPYKIMKNQQVDLFIAKLLSNGDIIKTADELQENVTKDTKDISSNVHIFKGYTLLSIIDLLNLSESHIDIAIGETYTLQAEVSPEIEVIWSVDNDAVVSISNGIVTGKALGDAVITIKAGNKSVQCTVTVHDYQDFYGGIGEFKSAIEKNENALFLRLNIDIEVEDIPDLFPIVIPKGKTVHIDFNKHVAGYTFSSKENCIYAFFVNNGGKLFLESFEDDIEYVQSYFYYSSKSTYDEYYQNTGTLIENRNGGLLVFEKISMSVMYDRLFEETEIDYSIAPNYVINNLDGELAVVESEIGFYNQINDSDKEAIIFNGEKSKATISGESRFSCNRLLVNYGLIDLISVERLRYFFTPILNYGTILEINGGVFFAGSEENTSIVHSIGNKAIIGKISGGTFGTDFSSVMSTLFEFSNGAKLGEITGGSFYSEDAEFVYLGGDITKLKVIKGISGGEFSHEVPKNLLASGYTCTFDSEKEMYIVSRK